MDFTSDKRWSGNAYVPESEMKASNPAFNGMDIKLREKSPLTSKFNSKESGAAIADEIMKKCEFTSSNNDDDFSDVGHKQFTRTGSFKVKDENWNWKIWISDKSSYNTVWIEVNKA